MSSILSTVLFASVAAAQITTSIWIPSSPFEEEDGSTSQYNFQASVVGAEGDAVTMAIQQPDEPGFGAETVTFHGTTAFENIITTTHDYGYEGDITLSYGCSKKGSQAECVISSNGPAAWSYYCEDYISNIDIETYTETYTYDSPDSTVEQVKTYDFRDQAPDFCVTGSLLPEEYAATTISAGNDKAMTYAVTITAGEEKLSATAGATPTKSGASSTGTGGVSAATSPTGSNSSTGPSGTPSSTPPGEQSTAAAAPMKTLAPALAGLGALVAALL